MIETLLSQYNNAGYPVIAVESHEDERIIEAMVSRWSSGNRKIYSIAAVGGLFNHSDGKYADKEAKYSKAFAFIQNQSNAFLVVRDFQHIVSGPSGYRELLNNIPAIKGRGCMVVLIAPAWNLPSELKHEVPVIQLPLPAPSELQISLDVAKEAVREAMHDAVMPTEEEEAQLLRAASGLTLSEAENVFALASKENFSFEIVEREKMRLVKSEYMTVQNSVPVEMLAGLTELKDYIYNEIVPCKDDIELMVRGLLFVGIPGVGKSLASKVIASILGWPIIRLDIAAAKGSRVGQSEGNMRNALATADAVAPCVLWLDEVEKAVGGYQSSGMTDSGTTLGMVGTYLTWAQEHTSQVMSVMTCNDYQKLPPELARPGRVDERFFLDLPNPKDALEVAKIHLKRLKCDEKMAKTVIKYAGEFTPAEIEQLIKSAARRTRREITEESIVACADKIKPMSQSSNMKEWREWAAKSFRRANNPEETSALPHRKLRGSDVNVN